MNFDNPFAEDCWSDAKSNFGTIEAVVDVMPSPVALSSDIAMTEVSMATSFQEQSQFHHGSNFQTSNFNGNSDSGDGKTNVDKSSDDPASTENRHVNEDYMDNPWAVSGSTDEHHVTMSTTYGEQETQSNPMESQFYQDLNSSFQGDFENTNHLNLEPNVDFSSQLHVPNSHGILKSANLNDDNNFDLTKNIDFYSLEEPQNMGSHHQSIFHQNLHHGNEDLNTQNVYGMGGIELDNSFGELPSLTKASSCESRQNSTIGTLDQNESYIDRKNSEPPQSVDAVGDVKSSMKTDSCHAVDDDDLPLYYQKVKLNKKQQQPTKTTSSLQGQINHHYFLPTPPNESPQNQSSTIKPEDYDVFGKLTMSQSTLYSSHELPRFNEHQQQHTSKHHEQQTEENLQNEPSPNQEEKRLALIKQVHATQKSLFDHVAQLDMAMNAYQRQLKENEILLKYIDSLMKSTTTITSHR